MCIAIIGSRTLSIPDLGIYLPKDTTEIISGGAKGVDTSAREYALAHHLPLTELRPDYRRYRACGLCADILGRYLEGDSVRDGTVRKTWGGLSGISKR